MSRAAYRHHGCRITDEITYKGFRTIFLENDLLRVGILLDKGADIYSLIYKPTDTDFLWVSPLGLVDPRQAHPTNSLSSGLFLDTYHGGWQEIFPGGGPANYRGAELGLHGEVAQLGWDYEIVVDSPAEIAVRFSVDCIRTPFQLERTLRLELGNPTLLIDETVTNKSPDEQFFMWGHHPALGEPFLQKGTRIVLPPCNGEVHSPSFAESSKFSPGSDFVWPLIRDINGKELDLSTCPGIEGGFADLIYLKDFQDGWYKVIHPDQPLGIEIRWDKSVFPYLWFWMVFGNAPGYPWWDRVHVIALEPWSSMPNNLDKAIERNTQSVLKGGGSRTVSLTARVISGNEAKV